MSVTSVWDTATQAHCSSTSAATVQVSGYQVTRGDMLAQIQDARHRLRHLIARDDFTGASNHALRSVVIASATTVNNEASGDRERFKRWILATSSLGSALAATEHMPSPWYTLQQARRIAAAQAAEEAAYYAIAKRVSWMAKPVRVSPRPAAMRLVPRIWRGKERVSVRRARSDDRYAYATYRARPRFRGQVQEAVVFLQLRGRRWVPLSQPMGECVERGVPIIPAVELMNAIPWAC